MKTALEFLDKYFSLLVILILIAAFVVPAVHGNQYSQGECHGLIYALLAVLVPQLKQLVGGGGSGPPSPPAI